MPRKTNKQLQEEIVALQATLAWTEGLNTSLITLLRTNIDFIKEIKEHMRLLDGAIDNSELVCTKTLEGIQEAITHARRKRSTN